MFLTALTIADTGSSSALRISAEVTKIVFGNPVAKSRPLISASGSPGSGKAEPIAILISSAVRSPNSRENSRLTQLIID